MESDRINYPAFFNEQMDRRRFICRLSTGLALAGGLGIASEPFASLLKDLPVAGTGYASDHDNIMSAHPHFIERPERLQWINRGLSDLKLLTELRPIVPVADPFPYISLAHTDEHCAAIKVLSRTGPAAERAVACSLGAVRDVCEGKITNAFCAIRPPGHHAHNWGREQGFCFYSNAAIAVKYAQKVYGLKRILIIDWDYHHGNGTQYAFYADENVLFFSTHDCNSYPGRFCDYYSWDNVSFKIGSDPSCHGVGPGEGYTINVHMPRHSAINEFIKVWREKLIPAATKFKPELIIISAGFDSKKNDLLGRFDLTEKGFSLLTMTAMDIAYKHCGGRLVSLLEGGYADSPWGKGFSGLALCVSSHVQTLLTGRAME
jgi:acetoin utilization deacetylase AcuC-like enzyme